MELPGDGQAVGLSFVDDRLASPFKLLELNDEMLKELVEGERIVLRGTAVEPVVALTATKTYEMRVADTSNSLLLFSMRTNPTRTYAPLHEIHELSETLPNFIPLRPLLQTRYFHHQDRVDQSHGFSIEEIEQSVLASRSELQWEIIQSGGFQLPNGRWCLLHPDSESDLLDEIMLTIRSEGWDVTNLPLASLQQLLPSEPKIIWQHLIARYIIQEVDKSLFDVSRYRIFHAIQLLQSKDLWPVEEFMNRWQEAVGEDGGPVSLNLLKKLAVVDEKLISYFPSSELPRDAQLRFKKLFEKKKRWNREEILPYLEEVPVRFGSALQLLSMWTHSSTDAIGKIIHTERAL